MADDGPEDERRRLKDNTRVEHILKEVARRDRAPPGHVAQPELTPAGPGGVTQTRRMFRSRLRDPREKSRNRDVPTAPPSRDGEERRFKRHDDREQGREPGRETGRRRDDAERKKEFRRLDRGDARRDFDHER